MIGTNFLEWVWTLLCTITKNGMVAVIITVLREMKSPICSDYGTFDVYDALRSKRVYKDAFSHEKEYGDYHF